MALTAYDKVKLIRGGKRPGGAEYIEKLISGFVELHGDRRYGDDAAVIGGIGFLQDQPVTIIAMEKGKSAKERALRNSGAPNPEGYRKALRLMKQAEKFGRPVLCLVDTAGAYCGIGAEERGQGQAIAENLMELSTLAVPVLSILIGEGGSGGALALAAADRVWMLENAVYSVISPEGCASILWKDPSKAETAAQSLKITAEDAKALGIIEDIISEEQLGSENFWQELQERIYTELQQLSAEPCLLEKRYERFRRMGQKWLREGGETHVSPLL